MAVDVLLGVLVNVRVGEEVIVGVRVIVGVAVVVPHTSWKISLIPVCNWPEPPLQT